LKYNKSSSQQWRFSVNYLWSLQVTTASLKLIGPYAVRVAALIPGVFMRVNSGATPYTFPHIYTFALPCILHWSITHRHNGHTIHERRGQGQRTHCPPSSAA